MLKLIFTVSSFLSLLLVNNVCLAQRSDSQTDTIKIQKKIKDLTDDLSDLIEQREKLLLKISQDSAKLDQITEESHDLQIKSRNSAKRAVGGSTSDNKRSEKDARLAKEATIESEEYEAKLKKERGQLQSINEKILKSEGKLADLRAKLSQPPAATQP